MALKICIPDLTEAYAGMGCEWKDLRGFGVRALLFRAKPASDTSGFNADTRSWLDSDFVGYARLCACGW
jgi:hypothetical protein